MNILGGSMDQLEEIKLISKILFDKFGAVTLDTKQASSAIGLSEITLKQNRVNGIGMPYVKLGKSVKYQITEIAKFISGNTIRVYT